MPESLAQQLGDAVKPGAQLATMGLVVAAIVDGPEGGKYASMSIMGLDPTQPTGEPLLPERAFQYWPAEIQDAIEVGWNFKGIPGASHALAQWDSNGGRTISFEVHISRFMKPVKRRTTLERLYDPFELNTPGSKLPINNRPHNVDVEAEVRYLRAFTYPYYADVEGIVSAIAPPIAVLCMPNMGLNENGSDVIFALMTGCDVTYRLLFPDGTPRKVGISLSFKQIVQKPNAGVFWKGHGAKAPSKYLVERPTAIEKPPDAIAAGGGRGTNNIRTLMEKGP